MVTVFISVTNCQWKKTGNHSQLVTVFYSVTNSPWKKIGNQLHLVTGFYSVTNSLWCKKGTSCCNMNLDAAAEKKNIWKRVTANHYLNKNFARMSNIAQTRVLSICNLLWGSKWRMFFWLKPSFWLSATLTVALQNGNCVFKGLFLRILNK